MKDITIKIKLQDQKPDVYSVEVFWGKNDYFYNIISTGLLDQELNRLGKAIALANSTPQLVT